MKFLLVSGTGFLGARLAKQFESAGVDFASTSRGGTISLDLERPVTSQIRHELESGGYTHGILCAAMTDVESCYRNPALSRRVNVEAPAELFQLFREFSLKPVYFSSDMIFDCTADMRREGEPPCPTTLYGRQKVEMENLLRAGSSEHLIFRTSKLMSMELHPRSILTPLAKAAAGEGPYRAFRDQFITPVFTEDAARMVTAAALGGLSGTFHLAGAERVSRAELGRLVCRHFGADDSLILETSIRDAALSEPRGNFHTLDAGKIRETLGLAFTPLEKGISELKKHSH